MAVVPAPAKARRAMPVGARRFGYVAAIIANGVMLWVAHHLLGWGWPGFLTDAFDQVLPLVTASLIVSMVINASLIAYDRGRFRALTDVVNNSFGLAVSIGLWRVFPFDFAGYARDWTGLVRFALAVGIAGTGIAIVIAVVKTIRGTDAR